jgi:hypothetical protein
VPQPSTSPAAAAAPQKYTVIDEFFKSRFTVEGKWLFKQAQLGQAALDFNANDLLFVLKNTRQYYQDYGAVDPSLQREGVLATQGVSLPQVLATLDFMIQTLSEDLAAKQPIRLKDPAFINQNFRVIEWLAYNPKDQGQERVRLTKYAVFTHEASRTRTGPYQFGIYALKPGPEADTLRMKYTKQDVVAGLFEPGGQQAGQVEPLAYMTREALEEALLQGTILLNFTDGSSGYFNVDRNNGIAYVKGLALRQQRRYWYFRKVDAIKGYGYSKTAEKISIKPGVTFAGDINNIGVGRMVVWQVNGKPRLGIIGDTGGAFLPNLYQLDFLAGVFPSRREYDQSVQNLPEYTRAYFLVKR